MSQEDYTKWTSEELQRLYVNSGDTTDYEAARAILEYRQTRAQERYNRAVVALTIVLALCTMLQAGVALFVALREPQVGGSVAPTVEEGRKIDCIQKREEPMVGE